MIEFEKRFVDLENIIDLFLNEVADDAVEDEAAGEGQPCGGEKLLRLFQIQLQRNGKGDCRLLGGLIGVGIALDLGKGLFIHVRLFVAFHVGDPPLVDPVKELVGKGLIHFL